MSKVRVTFPFAQTPTSSAFHNELIEDYITPAKLVLSYQFTADVAMTTTTLLADPQYVVWFPYNPLKSLYDTLRIHIASSGGSTTLPMEYSLDSGASWVAIGAGVLTGLPLSMPMANVANHFRYDVDLSTITTFQHVGLRIDWLAALSTWIEGNVFAYLFSSVDPP